MSFMVLWLWCAAFFGCAPTPSSSDPAHEMTTVALSAAFVELDYVDVYDEDGEYVETVDGGDDFQVDLPIGMYHMDFVSTLNGETHSFMEDGRIAFAPMMEGGFPFEVDHLPGVDHPIWVVEVHPDLEANARFNIRVQDGDPTLNPWRHLFDETFPAISSDRGDAESDEMFARYSTSSSSTSRLRVTWEASFAMTGNFTGSGTCNTATSCWRGGSTATPSGQMYAVYGAASTTGSGTTSGYIDYDTAAWSLLLASPRYASGYYVTCAGHWTPCYVTIGTSSAAQYTCQSTTTPCSASTRPRGAQCKAFQNLLLYRSGVYRTSGSWRDLPADSNIPSVASRLTTSTAEVGDVLRATAPVHSTLIVAWDSTYSTALVVDSNYVGGAEREYIGSNTLSFTGSKTASDLGIYYDLSCVYTGGC